MAETTKDTTMISFTPNTNDIKRSAERVSGANLDWYLVDWTQTTNTIDYGIKAVTENGNQTISLERIVECQCQLIC
jgi:hypothetical protein